MLKTTVSYGTDVLEDNNMAIQKDRNGATESNGKIDVKTNEDVFELTGLIIGGQCQHVGFDCISHEDNTHYNRMIYDAEIENGKIPAYGSSSTFVPNYTLVFDNYINADEQSKVYVALEFKNNGDDFWGMSNMIRKGGSFYIVGVIDPTLAENLSTLALPTTYTLPPYNEDGTSKGIKRVFMQGHTAEVNFVLGKYSLQYAYLTVPDLRSSQVSLGLSADLKWHTGLKYSSVIVGGNTQFGSN